MEILRSVPLGDRLRESLEELEAGNAGDTTLIDLAQRYSYVFPDRNALSTLAGLGPLVEMGAGTGYWAFRLRAIGANVMAYDVAPPDGETPNRYHASTATWTTVTPGDHTVLTEHPDRALFLCWPPLFSSLGECLTFYRGDTVALVGDGGHRTARVRGLDELFTAVSTKPVRALEPLDGVEATLSIWRRRSPS